MCVCVWAPLWGTFLHVTKRPPLPFLPRPLPSLQTSGVEQTLNGINEDLGFVNEVLSTDGKNGVESRLLVAYCRESLQRLRGNHVAVGGVRQGVTSVRPERFVGYPQDK